MTLTDRHREVLEAALALFSERGYAGATLRELARRLNISQPSLYTYFTSKEELVAQIISHLGSSMLAIAPDEPFPERLEDMAGFTCRLVMRIWRDPRYPLFVRFMFAVSLEQPRYREEIRKLYSGLLSHASAALAAPFVARGEVAPGVIEGVIHMIANTLGLSLIEHRLLWGLPGPAEDFAVFAQFVQWAAEAALTAGRTGGPVPDGAERRE